MAAEPRTRLSRRRILDAARAIAQGEGIDALSMRRLAQELDVWPMSVYRYFQDKDALLDAVAASAAEELELPSRRGSWRTQITQLLNSAREHLSSDPEGVAGWLPRAFFEPGALRLSEAAIEILTS